jgi:hypothetical protein
MPTAGGNGSTITFIDSRETERRQREEVRLSREREDTEARSKREQDIRQQLLLAVGGDKRRIWGRGF